MKNKRGVKNENTDKMNVNKYFLGDAQQTNRHSGYWQRLSMSSVWQVLELCANPNQSYKYTVGRVFLTAVLFLLKFLAY